MLRILQTFDGHAINDGSNYKAWLLNPNSLPAAQPVFISQSMSDSEDTGTYTVETQTLAVRIRIVNYANREALIAQLSQWFKRGTSADLVVMFTVDGLDYFKPCRVVNLVRDPESPLYFNALLQTGWSTWRAVNADTYTWNLTGTGGNHTVALSGDDEAPLSATFELTTGPANGYLYQRYYQLLNAPQTVPVLGLGPWCITIDTAALVANDSNKCQVNQVGGINASVTTIPYDTVTGSIPSVGMGYVDSEQIKWTGKTGTTSGNLTGVTRGIGGTTAATHADNAVIRLSYVLANGNDLRVFIDGKEANRWIANMNNASTKVWFNITLGTGYNLALRTAIASSGAITTMDFALTQDVASALSAMPNEGILVHGTEWFKYKGKNLQNYQLLITARGILGSTMQAHSVADVISYMEHVVNLCYGKSAATDPAATDTKYNNAKPVFVLSSSSNSSWVYDNTSAWWDNLGTGRTGGWRPRVQLRLGPNSYAYYIERNATSGDPTMGMRVAPFLQDNGYIRDVASVVWEFARACGINTTTFAGEKYRGDTAWLEQVSLQNTDTQPPYINIWSEATPGSAATWTALASHSGVSMGDVKSMRFILEGTIPAGANQMALFEIQTGTINFTSANLPSGTLLSQQVSAQLALTLTNGANADALGIDIPMLPGLLLALDGEVRTVLYDGVNAHEVMTLDDESRDWWTRLQPGNNQLTIAAADVGTLEVVLTWYRRRF